MAKVMSGKQKGNKTQRGWVSAQNNPLRWYLRWYWAWKTGNPLVPPAVGHFWDEYEDEYLNAKEKLTPVCQQVLDYFESGILCNESHKLIGCSKYAAYARFRLAMVGLREYMGEVCDDEES